MTRTRIRPWLQDLLFPRFAKPWRRPRLRLELEVLEDRRTPALLTVNTAADAVNPTDGTLSMRDAITAVNAGNENGLTTGEQNQVSGTFGVNDTIEFSSMLSGDTIALSGALPTLGKNLTITGLGADSLAISGGGSTVFTVASAAQVSISGLTIQKGRPSGIANNGTLTVSGCTLANNGAPGGPLGLDAAGAGVDNTGTLTVVNSTFLNNTTDVEHLIPGGGIYSSGTLTVSGSTFSGNVGYNGGGIDNVIGTATVINSTFWNNFAFFGGGIYNSDKLTVTNSTLANNTGQTNGGGIESGPPGGFNAGGSSATTLNNTIVASSPKGGDLYLASGQGSANTFSGSNDLIGDGSDLSSFSNSLQGNPLLGPLGNYGGPTQTLELSPGSPAINAGSNALAIDANALPLTTDQRGQPRIVGAAVDLGAFESPLNFDKLAAYRPSDGSWSLDSDGTLGFNSATDQVFFSFSPPGVTPVAGDWTGTGHDNIGDFQNGVWHLDLNGNGVLDSGETFTFGQAGDKPVVGDWNGDGKTDLGVFRAAPDGITGEFILDTNEDHVMGPGDETFTFGLATDRIVVGDWNGQGKDEVGVFRDAASYIPADAGDAVFSLDSSNQHTFNASSEVFVFGLISDGVVIGDWNGSGTDKVGVYRSATAFGAPNTAVFSLDTTGDLQFNSTSKVFLYGLITDQFVTGNWAPTPPLLPEGTPPAQFAANGAGPGAAALTEAQLAPVVQQTIAYWTAQGANPAQLEAVPVQIGQLDSNLVGWTDANGITISTDAAGWGWYTGTSSNVPANQMDLLTVVEHEFGHEVGLSDVDPGTHPGDIMDSTLPTGVRR